MHNKILPFSALFSQSRWKVEFFLSNRRECVSVAYPVVRLSDVLVERRESLDPQQYPDHIFNYVSLEHIEPLTGDLIDGYAPREGRMVLSRSKVFYRGDILYGRLRPSLNKVFVADGLVSQGICSGEFYVLSPDVKRTLPNLVRALLASRYVQDVVKSLTTGSALPRLALKDLLAIEVPLPPLGVQQQFEELLVGQNSKRQQIKADLRDGPAADIAAIVAALEEGSEPMLPRPRRDKRLAFDVPALPSKPASATTARRRSASSRSKRSLF